MNTKRQYTFSCLRGTLLLALGVLFWVVPHTAQAAAPAPQPRPPTDDCYLDNIYYGAIPPSGPNSPVLVFVHGYGGLASDWWVNEPNYLVNDTYDLAYAAGYRTAFVNLNFNDVTCQARRKPVKQILINGYTFDRQLDEIIRYYHVDQVDIVAHSKGGIDAQMAVVNSGAWPNVRNLFTLGTPHQGSLLADLLWSSDASWLTDIIGDRDAGSWSLQTAPMQVVRQATDSRTVDDLVDYFIGAGNGWYTSDKYEFTGSYLQEHPFGGDNDGVATVLSTRLANSHPLFLQPWNHDDLLVGHNIFPYIHAILLGEPTNTVGLALNGPDVGYVDKAVVFTAQAPLTTTQPVSYTWQATGQNEVLVTNGLSSTVTFTWQQPGEKLVTVTAHSASGTNTKSRPIRIDTIMPPVDLSVAGPDTVQVHRTYDFVAALPLSTTFPIRYLWQATDQPDLITVAGSRDTQSFLWANEGTKVITVTASNIGGSISALFAVEVGPLLPPSGLTLFGLTQGSTATPYLFTAQLPDTVATPLIYTWEATDHAGVLKTGSRQDNIQYTWQTPGVKTIRVSAANEGGVVSATQVISIAQGSDDTSSLLFLPLVNGRRLPAQDVTPNEHVQAGAEEVQPTASQASYILRGGYIGGSAETVVAIEPEVSALDFTLLASSPDVSGVLVAPDGSHYPLALEVTKRSGLLAGASQFIRHLDSPAPGQWSVLLSSPSPAGYLLIAEIDSNLDIQLQGLPEGTILTPRQPILLHVESAGTAQPVTIEQISASFGDNGALAQDAEPEERVAVGDSLPIGAPSQEGFHTLSVTIQGHDANGGAFERTFVRSFAVISDQANPNLLQLLQSWLGAFD